MGAGFGVSGANIFNTLRLSVCPVTLLYFLFLPPRLGDNHLSAKVIKFLPQLSRLQAADYLKYFL